MDHYHIWCNLKDSHRDLEFCDAVHAWLGHIKDKGGIASYTLQRRKLGFGPDALGEFHIDILVNDLAQLDAAFTVAATRAPPTERLHADVYARITDFKSALYRDFPDAVRARTR